MAVLLAIGDRLMGPAGPQRLLHGGAKGSVVQNRPCRSAVRGGTASAEGCGIHIRGLFFKLKFCCRFAWAGNKRAQTFWSCNLVFKSGAGATLLEKLHLDLSRR